MQPQMQPRVRKQRLRLRERPRLADHHYMFNCREWLHRQVAIPGARAIVLHHVRSEAIRDAHDAGLRALHRTFGERAGVVGHRAHRIEEHRTAHGADSAVRRAIHSTTCGIASRISRARTRAISAAPLAIIRNQPTDRRDHASRRQRRRRHHTQRAAALDARRLVVGDGHRDAGAAAGERLQQRVAAVGHNNARPAHQGNQVRLRQQWQLRECSAARIHLECSHQHRGHALRSEGRGRRADNLGRIAGARMCGPAARHHQHEVRAAGNGAARSSATGSSVSMKRSCGLPNTLSFSFSITSRSPAMRRG